MPEPPSDSCEACTKRAPLATSPKFQPSPIRFTSRPVAWLTRSRKVSIAARGWCPIRSKRNESILYWVAHNTAESIMSLPIIRFSVAVLAQQVECSTAPLASRRW